MKSKFLQCLSFFSNSEISSMVVKENRRVRHLRGCFFLCFFVEENGIRKICYANPRWRGGTNSDAVDAQREPCATKTNHSPTSLVAKALRSANATEGVICPTVVHGREIPRYPTPWLHVGGVFCFGETKFFIDKRQKISIFS